MVQDLQQRRCLSMVEFNNFRFDKNMCNELKINLKDTGWKYDYIDRDRNIARAYKNSGGIL